MVDAVQRAGTPAFLDSEQRPGLIQNNFANLKRISKCYN
jgi:hypothetical protein